MVNGKVNVSLHCAVCVEVRNLDGRFLDGRRAEATLDRRRNRKAWLNKQINCLIPELGIYLVYFRREC